MCSSLKKLFYFIFENINVLQNIYWVHPNPAATPTGHNDRQLLVDTCIM